MLSRRILLMHVTTSSGHHHASRAISQAVRRLDPSCQLINVDAFDYTSRFVRWAIMRSYMSLIRRYPDVWEFLYDNPAIHRHVKEFRELLHRYHTRKLQRLFETVQPHAIACTQAFPCGMVADFKKHRGLSIPLVGVLTDYAPHLYWLHDTVDRYLVPAAEVKERFVSYGIPEARIQDSGIPVEPKFLDPVDPQAVYQQFGLDPGKAVVMVMGGGGGFGPIHELMLSLDRASADCQFIVLAGTNQALLSWLRRYRFRHPVVGQGYTDAVAQLMSIAAMVITKPGGLTTAEALAKQVPLLIFMPIPGQEMCNARYLLARRAAVQISATDHAGETVSSLLRSPERLARMREAAAALGHPDSAFQAARLMLELADARKE
jgi:processive 1,2-diacylglycerol beta-glucosyltransferase